MHLAAADDEFSADSGDWSFDLPDMQTGSAGTDWTGLVEKALTVWGSVEVASQQADVAKAQAQYSYRAPTLATTTARLPGGTVTYPGYGSPVNAYGVPAQNDTWLLLAAAGIVAGAYLFTRK